MWIVLISGTIVSTTRVEKRSRWVFRIEFSFNGITLAILIGKRLPVKSRLQSFTITNWINSFFSFFWTVIRVGDAYTRQQSQLMDFHFVGNSIRSTDDPIQILVADNFNLHLSQLQFETPIDCDAASQIENNNFLMHFGDTVYFHIGQSATESNNFTLTEIVTRECRGVSTSTLIAIISATTVLLIVVVVVLGFVAFRHIEQRRQERQLNVVMPEGKTYRETQIVMQIERAGLMKTDLWRSQFMWFLVI